MLCPTCDNVNLAMADRQGIEIDYCPQCRGIWLDRGELDRLIERTEQASAPALPSAPPPYRDAHARDDRPRHSGDRRHDGKHGHYARQPKSLLGELFDF
ncbi:TFIIB-type zinc ribbon-containing protein [Luteimonas notoginsengisoli]|uniref:Zf-TFIIB domain-containing protein n=1 Tax=Luteimonas notoginsengisoli TaxID=1578200 RepID=A0ABV7UU11_9GAMM